MISTWGILSMSTKRESFPALTVTEMDAEAEGPVGS